MTLNLKEISESLWKINPNLLKKYFVVYFFLVYKSFLS